MAAGVGDAPASACHCVKSPRRAAPVLKPVSSAGALTSGKRAGPHASGDLGSRRAKRKLRHPASLTSAVAAQLADLHQRSRITKGQWSGSPARRSVSKRLWALVEELHTSAGVSTEELAVRSGREAQYGPGSATPSRLSRRPLRLATTGSTSRGARAVAGICGSPAGGRRRSHSTGSHTPSYGEDAGSCRRGRTAAGRGRRPRSLPHQRLAGLPKITGT